MWVLLLLGGLIGNSVATEGKLTRFERVYRRYKPDHARSDCLATKERYQYFLPDLNTSFVICCHSWYCAGENHHEYCVIGAG